MKLQTLRVSAGWSRQFVADRLGVSRQAVWLWETGRQVPAADKAVALAKLFGVTAEYLMEV